MFPVSSTILSAPALADFLGETYAFETPPQCRLLRAGINHSYLVTVGSQRFVLRIYSLGWRSETEIREELGLLDQLREAGLSVSYALPDAGGKRLQLLQAPEGPRYAVLFSYAPGEKIIDNGIATHRSTGMLMARMHRASATLPALRRRTYSYNELVLQGLQQLGEFLPPDSSELLQLAALLEGLRPVLEPALQQLPKGIVHLDIWFDNLNVDKNGTVTLFDFDFCGNGALALDPAYYLLQLHFLNPEAYAQNAAAFLAGYEQVRPLSAAERDALPALGIALYCFYLGVQCERFENYSSVFVSETYLKRYILARILRYAAFQGLPVGKPE